QLARMGALEDRLRSGIDRGAEQRASAIAALSRELSRAAGRQDASGTPQQAAQDLARLGERVPELTAEQRAALTRQLSELEGLAREVSPEARAALHEAAQAVSGGDAAAAQGALGRLGEALGRAAGRV